MDHKKLVSLAITAKKRSYSPYSKFRVGAALLSTRGEVFTGCNIENSSYSLTICAERTALFRAYADGARKFKAIAIVSDSAECVPPCGACRQVLVELAPGIEVILANRSGRFVSFMMEELLPQPFTKKFLK